jgi:hypothetical protein
MYQRKLLHTLLLLSAALAVCTGAALFPYSLSTAQGSVSTTDLTALKTKDESDSEDTWADYLEFNGTDEAYIGTFSFDASTLATSTISSYFLNVNFKGPQYSDQVWEFEWLVPSSGSWIAFGNNTNVVDWIWSSLSFAGTAAFSSLVNAQGIVQLRFSSKTAYDNCDVDFLQLVTTTPSTSSASTPAPTTRPTSAPTTRPTSAPTTVPTSAPTTRPTSAPTSEPTSPPTGSSGSGGSGGRVCPVGTRYVPGIGTTWQWQLSGTVDTSFNVQAYDIDMFGSSTALISSLHNQGRAVICYIDTAYEPGRPDSSQFTRAVLGNAIDGWPGQKWVDIRSSVVRNIMVNRLALAASKNCDAVEMDDVDSYQNNPVCPSLPHSPCFPCFPCFP